PAGKITLAAAQAADGALSEVVRIRKVSSEDLDHTVLTLAEALHNVYDRATVTIFGNVALATHGESVRNEVLGSGDASQPYHPFALRQSPLTFVAAGTP